MTRNVFMMTGMTNIRSLFNLKSKERISNSVKIWDTTLLNAEKNLAFVVSVAFFILLVGLRLRRNSGRSLDKTRELDDVKC